MELKPGLFEQIRDYLYEPHSATPENVQAVALLWAAYDEIKNRRAAPENKPLTLEQLKTENAQLRAVIAQSDPGFFERKCRICGCDWNHPCNDHDYWIEDDLCSACARRPEAPK